MNKSKTRVVIYVGFFSSRYAVRLLYDEAILGRMESFIDLDECLQDYRDRYYIGCETDEEWSSCVLERKPHLFSFGHDTENVGL